jgi:hypothetical protein
VAVHAVLEVRFVVPIVVRDRVVQREAVVRGDEIEARGRLAGVVTEQVARAGEALRERAQQRRIPAPVRADGITIAVVSIRTSGGKVSG